MSRRIVYKERKECPLVSSSDCTTWRVQMICHRAYEDLYVKVRRSPLRLGAGFAA